MQRIHVTAEPAPASSYAGAPTHTRAALQPGVTGALPGNQRAATMNPPPQGVPAGPSYASGTAHAHAGSMMEQDSSPNILSAHARRLSVGASARTARVMVKRKVLEEHPTIVGSNGSIKKVPLCESTGYYGFGTFTKFAAFGGGMLSYFKTLKTLAIAFFCISLLSLPALVLNTFGEGSDFALHKLTLSATTVGHLASISNFSDVSVPFSKAKVSKANAAMIYAICDIVGVAIFLLTFVCMKYWQYVEDIEMSANNISLDQYSLFVRGVPHDVKERELKAHFQELAPDSRVTAVQVVRDNMHLYGMFVRRGKVFRKLERVEERIQALETYLNSSAAEPDPCCGGPRRALAKLYRQRQRLVWEATAMTDEASNRTSHDAVAAFVTYEHQATKALVEEDYSSSAIRWLCQPRRLRLRQTHRLGVQTAPAPSAVLWENLNTSIRSRILRRLFTTFLAVLVVVGSFILLFFTSVEQAKLAAADVALRCDDADILGGLANNTINAASVASLNINDPRLFCFCETVGFSRMEYRLLASHALTAKCPSQTCPAFFKTAPDTLSSLQFCVDWIKQQTVTTTLILAASLGIVAVNMTLGWLMRVLTKFEAHHSGDALERSLARRLFVAQYINTAALIVVINAPIEKYIATPFYTSKYDDLSPDWYSNVGVNLMTTMLIQIISPHVAPICLYLYGLYRKKRTNAVVLGDLEDIFRPPPAAWSVRYAQVFAMVFVCYTFSTGMPLMNIIAFASLVTAYWFDKFFFARLWSKPPTYGSIVTQAMHDLLPVAMLLHLAVGAWALSNNQVFSESFDPLGVRGAAVAAMAAGGERLSVVSYALGRVAKGQSLPMLIAFFVLLFVLVVQLLVIMVGAFARTLLNLITCGQCTRYISSNGDPPLALRIQMPSLSQATDVVYCQAHPHQALRSEHTYSMLLNKKVQAAFAVVPEFAQMVTSLGHVARYNMSLTLVDGREQLVATWTATNRSLLQAAPPGRGAAVVVAHPAAQVPAVMEVPPGYRAPVPLALAARRNAQHGHGGPVVAAAVGSPMQQEFVNPMAMPYDDRVVRAAVRAAEATADREQVAKMHEAVASLRRQASMLITIEDDDPTNDPRPQSNDPSRAAAPQVPAAIAAGLMGPIPDRRAEFDRTTTESRVITRETHVLTSTSHDTPVRMQDIAADTTSPVGSPRVHAIGTPGRAGLQHEYEVPAHPSAVLPAGPNNGAAGCVPEVAQDPDPAGLGAV